MKVLVTGATGFIGSHLVRYLVMQGYHVRALVRDASRGSALVEACVEPAQRDPLQSCHPCVQPGVEFVSGDITDREAVRDAMHGMEAVFHLAAVRDVWGTPESVYQRVNVEGTRLVLEAAAEVGVQCLVYCSSVGVARYPGNLEADETLPLCVPTSQVFYHRSKAQAEQMALEWARSGRVPAVVVRPVITYGPGDEGGMVTRLVTMLAQGRFILVGNGRNHVDLAYIDDLIAGMCLALERGRVGSVYILSGTAPIQVQMLIDKICELLRKQPPRIHVPAVIARTAGWGMETLYRACSRILPPASGEAGGVKEPFITRDKVATLTVDRGFSHARASRELGYQPQVGYDEGLRRTLDWLRDKGHLQRAPVGRGE